MLFNNCSNYESRLETKNPPFPLFSCWELIWWAPATTAQLFSRRCLTASSDRSTRPRTSSNASQRRRWNKSAKCRLQKITDTNVVSPVLIIFGKSGSLGVGGCALPWGKWSKAGRPRRSHLWAHCLENPFCDNHFQVAKVFPKKKVCSQVVRPHGRSSLSWPARWFARLWCRWYHGKMSMTDQPDFSSYRLYYIDVALIQLLHKMLSNRIWSSQTRINDWETWFSVIHIIHYTTNDQVRLWNVETGICLAKLEGHKGKVGEDVDSIAVSVFAHIFIELTNTVSDNNIQITILILWRGSCLVSWSDRLQFRSFCMQQEMLDLNYKAESKHNWLLLSSSPPRLKPTRIYSNMQCQ